jgi:hypothetical protein
LGDKVRIKFKKGLVRYGLILITIVFTLTFLFFQVKRSSSEVITNNFTVSIINETHDLTYHEVIFSVQNLNPDKSADFYVGTLFQDTSFDLDFLKDVYIYELKPTNKIFNNYTSIPTTNYYPYPTNATNFTLPFNCYDYNLTHYVCNETITINNPYWAMVLDWKPSKMALIKQKDRKIGTYGYVTIPKFGSK